MNNEKPGLSSVQHATKTRFFLGYQKVRVNPIFTTKIQSRYADTKNTKKLKIL